MTYKIVLIDKTIIECKKFETISKGSGLIGYPSLFIKAENVKINNKENLDEIIIPITSILYIFHSEGKWISF